MMNMMIMMTKKMYRRVIPHGHSTEIDIHQNLHAEYERGCSEKLRNLLSETPIRIRYLLLPPSPPPYNLVLRKVVLSGAFTHVLSMYSAELNATVRMATMKTQADSGSGSDTTGDNDGDDDVDGGGYSSVVHSDDGFGEGHMALDKEDRFLTSANLCRWVIDFKEIQRGEQVCTL